MDDATKKIVQSALQRIKNSIRQRNFIWWPKPENEPIFKVLGFTKEDAKKIILNLQVIDYYKGPEPCHKKKKKAHIWVFRKKSEGWPLYIKIAIPDDSKNPIIIQSFKKDEPYKRL